MYIKKEQKNYRKEDNTKKSVCVKRCVGNKSTRTNKNRMNKSCVQAIDCNLIETYD